MRQWQTPRSCIFTQAILGQPLTGTSFTTVTHTAPGLAGGGCTPAECGFFVYFQETLSLSVFDVCKDGFQS